MKNSNNHSKTIIISPSGNFYGSEQVLFDFLKQSELQYTVYVPKNSVFETKLKTLNKHQVATFQVKNIHLFYLKIIFLLIFKNISGLYVNEGGHINYVRFLARFFPNKNFVLHIRMIYDASLSRLGTRLPNNLKLIAISDYVGSILPVTLSFEVIFDPYYFDTISITNNHAKPKPLKVGIVGRISMTKGLKEIESLLLYLEKKKIQQFEFHFFGHIGHFAEVLEIVHRLKNLETVKTIFHGFATKHEIYNSIDVVLHACREEGLGRIYLEAMSKNLPLIGFNDGGIKELGNIFGLQQFLINFDEHQVWITQMVAKLADISNFYSKVSAEIQDAKNKKGHLFDINNYTQKIEEKINA